MLDIFDILSDFDDQSLQKNNVTCANAKKQFMKDMHVSLVLKIHWEVAIKMSLKQTQLSSLQHKAEKAHFFAQPRTFQ